MTYFTAKPERTFALVVGIAKYQESSWNVKSGATVKDALKFACWLRERGVPTDNINLCLSPLEEHREENQALLKLCGLSVEEANYQNIDHIITNILSQKTGDLLYIFWAGHGLITSERERRLFCADVTRQNWQNIDLNSLLLLLSSDYFQIRNHICIIDACANYLLETEGRPTNLGGRIFNSGKPQVDSQHFVLLATKEGEKAKVSAEGKTGYFSQAVLKALEQAPSEIFLPDMKAIAEEVKQHVASLDKKQLPTYLYYRNWDGDVEKNYLNPNPFSIPQNIPVSSAGKFVGRETELESLQQNLQRNPEVVITAVEGMGGVGKTELAIQYSLLQLQLHTYRGGICWLQARESDIGLQIIQFARTHLDLQPPDDLELPERVRWCWRHWHQGNTLVVLDDVKSYGDIKVYLPPQQSQFKVLITTRLKLDLAASLSLSVLQEKDALELLEQLIGAEKVSEELKTAEDLIQRLGYLPLALQLVGRYVKERNISLTEMLQRLEKKGLGHKSMVIDENDPNWTLNIKRGVAAAFELSWSELSEPTQKLGCLLSLFALAPIPWFLVENAAPEQDSEELEDARVKLEKLHLLQSKDSYQLHQLIREFFREKQNNLASAEEQKSNLCKTLVKEAEKIPYSPTQEMIKSVEDAIPHLKELAKNLIAAMSDSDLIWVFVGLSRFYEGQGLYTLAEPWRLKCLSVVKNRLGEEHPDVASSINNLALLYNSQGRYTEAEPLYIQALALRRRLLGEEHPDVATSINNLAVLYYSQGRYTDAEPLYIQALALTRRLLGEEHPSVAQGLNNLAVLYYSQGRYADAEPLYIQALALRRRLLGEEHPDVAQGLNNLAGLYDSQGRYADAEPLFIQALALTRRLLGEEHPSVATSINNLAGLYNSQGMYADAEPLYVQALALKRRLLGEEHPSVATSINNLAVLYDSQGRYADAEPLYVQALALTRRLLGEEHPSVAQSINNLALLYSYQGRCIEAEPLFIQALAICEHQLGIGHPSTILIRGNYATFLRQINP